MPGHSTSANLPSTLVVVGVVSPSPRQTHKMNTQHKIKTSLKPEHSQNKQKNALLILLFH